MKILVKKTQKTKMQLNKFKSINNLKSKASLVFLVVLALFFFQLQSRVFAQDNSEASESTEQTTIDNIKKVIQEKKDELREDGVATRKKQAYLAKVTRVSEETLAVQSLTSSEIVPLSNEIKIISAAKKEEISVDQIAVGDWVAIYGDKEGQVLSTKQIVLYEDDYTPSNHQIVLGSIEEIYPQSIAITPRLATEKVSYVLNKSSKFQDYEGKDATFKDFYEDLQCLIVSTKDSKGSYVVSTVRALVEF